MRYLITAVFALLLLSGCDKEDRDDREAENPKPQKVSKKSKETKVEVVTLKAAGEVRFKTVILDGKEYVVTSRNGPFPTDGQSYILEESLASDWETTRPSKDCGPVG